MKSDHPLWSRIQGPSLDFDSIIFRVIKRWPTDRPTDRPPPPPPPPPDSIGSAGQWRCDRRTDDSSRRRRCSWPWPWPWPWRRRPASSFGAGPRRRRPPASSASAPASNCRRATASPTSSKRVRANCATASAASPTRPVPLFDCWVGFFFVTNPIQRRRRACSLPFTGYNLPIGFEIFSSTPTRSKSAKYTCVKIKKSEKSSSWNRKQLPGSITTRHLKLAH